MIRVVIVEDDFRVARSHAQVVNAVAGFTVAGSARTLAAAAELLSSAPVDLVLMDRYLPDGDGISFATGVSADVFFLSAEDSAQAFAAAVRAGAVNYLIKPFSAAVLGERLRAYAAYRRAVTARATLTQEDMDEAFAQLHGRDTGTRRAAASPTAAAILQLLADGTTRTVLQVAEDVGIGRATAQRYLSQLARAGSLSVRLNYGSTGRPEHLYARAVGRDGSA